MHNILHRISALHPLQPPTCLHTKVTTPCLGDRGVCSKQYTDNLVNGCQELPWVID